MTQKKIFFEIILICLSFSLICSCLSPHDRNKTFNDGEDISTRQDYKAYRSDLEIFLTSQDSIESNSKPILPPNVNALNSENIYLDTLNSEKFEIVVKPANSHECRFVSAFEGFNINNDSINYRLSAYDSRLNIVYITERKKSGHLRLFGIVMNTGNQFTVFEKNNKGFNERMFSWSFSPDFNYLLKIGDIEPNSEDNLYGWSLVNLKDGVEGRVRLKRYKEFISNPQWVDNQQFKYTLVEIPFKEGQKYDKDYKLYHALLNNQPLPKVKILKYKKLYPVVYTYHVKGYLMSERMHEYDTELIH